MTTISPQLIEDVIKFHGHKCPGVAIGIRAAEIALRDIGAHSIDEEVVLITETDMCGVDAIQVLTGCTFGKGNLRFLDYGKVAFSFYNRTTGKSLRMKINPSFTFNRENKEEGYQTILNCKLEDLFLVEHANALTPKKARIVESFLCEKCSEKTMETKARLLEGKKYCIPCFENI
ncbi:MAG: TraR/DksA C4-type zinc finger protein [Oligoflexia bacterium]|nr:TraR/DksA C4-type zinc finger protein [Oligoflexia bacterium]